MEENAIKAASKRAQIFHNFYDECTSNASNANKEEGREDIDTGSCNGNGDSFESAVKVFNDTVQVLRRRNKADQQQQRPFSNSSSSSYSSEDEEDTSSSENDGGLDTITEEERTIMSQSDSTDPSGSEGESDLEDSLDSSKKTSNGIDSQEFWTKEGSLSTSSSSTGSSSSSSYEVIEGGSASSTRRCNDFKWIIKSPSTEHTQIQEEEKELEETKKLIIEEVEEEEEEENNRGVFLQSGPTYEKELHLQLQLQQNQRIFSDLSNVQEDYEIGKIMESRSKSVGFERENEDDKVSGERSKSVDERLTSTPLISNSNNGSKSSLSKSNSGSIKRNEDLQQHHHGFIEEDGGNVVMSQNKPPIHRSSSSRQSSLDRRRYRQERDQKSRSSHVPKSPSPQIIHEQQQHQYHAPSPLHHISSSSSSCQGWCCGSGNNLPLAYPPYPGGVSGGDYDNFHRRHERNDPQRYGSSPMLMEQHRHGSHPDLYSSPHHYNMNNGGFYHMPPPPCYCCYDSRPSYPPHYWNAPPAPVKGSDYEEKFRKLQNERDNLQLQVQVLGEQIEAQTDKIGDLEKNLQEKKQMLLSTEEQLQREMLSRSSLETQKLELMSAMSELKLQQAALEREILELRSSHMNNNSSEASKKLVGYSSRMSPQPHQTSTPVHHGSNQALNSRMSPSPSPVASGQQQARRIETSTPLQHESGVQQPPKTPPASYRRQIDLHFASLPRQQFLSNGGSSLSVLDSNANSSSSSGGSKRGVVAFGRGLQSLLVAGRNRGHSVPNLGAARSSELLSLLDKSAETEKIIIEDVGNNAGDTSSLQFNKNKSGIKKIFGKMKRSGSGNLEDIPGLPGEFQRGGIRATAAARLGWSEPQINKRPDKPFVEWNTEEISVWLEDLGLEQYVAEAKRWIKSGQQLQEAPIHELERELNIKNPLHRKKLQLAIVDTQENGSSDTYLSMAGKLDTAWVLRWLDDTGLPQHKENFLINRVDGRVLHRLTMEDLQQLHVTSLLHVASLKRGIQILRENNYESGCLIRRATPEDSSQPTPKQISLWTTHRVMEWLRAVDLAEYAPNLRGAGVHGGLMVLENKFTAELLASLLSIPPGKTLLRRHLNTHFKELLGKDIIQAKREAESTLGYVPLTPGSKLKVPKKSHFSLKRNKSKGEADYGDLVCPLNNDNSGELVTSAGSNGFGGVNSSSSSPNMGTMRLEGPIRGEDVYQLLDSATSSPISRKSVKSNADQFITYKT